MRRITIWFVLTVGALMLLFSYHTSTSRTSAVASAEAATIVPSPTTQARDGASAPAAAPPRPPGAGSSTRSAPQPSAASPTTTDAVQTVDGALERTERGPVRVRVTFQGGKILEVTPTALPQGGRDRAIAAAAVPILHDEVLSAQGTDVDLVSGATLTSKGYLSSVQSAIDELRAGN